MRRTYDGGAGPGDGVDAGAGGERPVPGGEAAGGAGDPTGDVTRGAGGPRAGAAAVGEWGRRRLLRGVGAVAAGAVAASAAGAAAAAAPRSRRLPADGPAAGSARSDAAADGPAASEPGWSRAEASGAAPARAEVAGVAVCRAGRFEVVALLDAHGTFPLSRTDAFPGASAGAWADARRVDPRAFGPGDAWELDFRCFAVRRPGGRVVLVDSGVGPAGSPAASWAPVPGLLPGRLAAAGIAPGDVDAVVLSHLHEDHYGWSVTPDGRPAFPRARYVVQAAELAALAPGDAAVRYAVDPLRAAGRLHVVDGGTRLAGGRGGAVTLVPTPGHTPGHQSVVVDGGRRQIVIAGDVLVHAVQLADPAVRYFFEEDPGLARRTRRRLLERARERGAVLATAHLNRPFVPLG
ncbi:MBL fold metallo-hydrolase [Streptomyces sp. CMB-StM0423]|uniref:MBL fold metallo-hydrolase n=1 Tax=Streptomyces sp. CMB-StM0423 TaxID=2059884 RepID=UPI001F29D37B|nr:MBL fold metallo-hydrolase [Streptomyces sp. CMB-StM0423]